MQYSVWSHGKITKKKRSLIIFQTLVTILELHLRASASGSNELLNINKSECNWFIWLSALLNDLDSGRNRRAARPEWSVGWISVLTHFWLKKPVLHIFSETCTVDKCHQHSLILRHTRCGQFLILKKSWDWTFFWHWKPKHACHHRQHCDS